MVGEIGNRTTSMEVSVTTGPENLTYSPCSVVGATAAPELGAASYRPVADETPDLRADGATNRHGDAEDGAPIFLMLIATALRRACRSGADA